MELIARTNNKAIIRDFYQQILSRDPDPRGAENYERLIERLGLIEAIPALLAAFLGSQEYRDRMNTAAVSQINLALAASGKRLINGLPVHHVVSLGPYCLPSIILQGAGLKKYSLPFDWIYSAPQMVIDCLADDFAMFLDRRYYSSISHPTRKDPGAEHHFYRDQYGIKELFAHRDPTGGEDYLYLVRCVERFRQLLRADDTKLFLVVGRPAPYDLTSDFPRLIEALERATTNFVLLCVEVADPIEPGVSALAPVAKIGEHAFYRLTPSSYAGDSGGAFLEKFDEWALLRLVYRYQLSLKESI